MACIRSRRRSRPAGGVLTTCWWPASAHDDRLEQLVALCREAGVRVRQEAREQLTQLAQTPAHQGVVALVRPQEFLAIEDLFEPPRTAAQPPARPVAAGSGWRGRPAKPGRSAARGRRRRSGWRGAHRAAFGAPEPGSRQGQRRSGRASAHRPRRQPRPRPRRAQAPESLDHRPRRARRGPTTTSSTSPATASSCWAARARACTIWSAAPATTCCAFPWRRRQLAQRLRGRRGGAL